MPIPSPARILEDLSSLAGRACGIVLYPHAGADGDALGASIGLALVLGRCGFRTRVLLEEPVISTFRFLPGAGEARVYAPASASEISDFQDVGIAIDCEGPTRLGERAALFQSAAHRLVVDHHPSAPTARTDPDGIERFVVATASCTGELILRMLQDLEVRFRISLLDRDVATCLLTALLYDTGGFRFSNTNADSFAAAAVLSSAGADLRDLNRRLFEAMSPSRFRLLGRAFSDTRFACGGRIAVLSLPTRTLEECAAVESDLDGFAGMLRDVEGVEASFVLRERTDGTVRGNIRCGAGFDASAFARSFGGGGHLRAAGFTLSERLENAEARILSEAERLLECQGDP